MFGAESDAEPYLPKRYSVSRLYMQLRLWERLKISLAEQDALTPGELAVLLEFEAIREHEEFRFAGFASSL